MEWSWPVFLDAFPYVFKGISITLLLTMACYIFSLLFGFFWLFIRQVSSKPLQWLIYWVMEFIRSTPPLIQLFFIYYAWPMIPVAGVTLHPFLAAVLGLGVHFSTYISEVYRAGIESVDRGQWEAAKALNFSVMKKWTKIILPQAIPPTIPMLGNYLIIMFKEVPLASTIGVVGMLHMANEYGSIYWKYLEPLTIVALLFLALSYPSALFIRKLEQKYNRNFNKKQAALSKPA